MSASRHVERRSRSAERTLVGGPGGDRERKQRARWNREGSGGEPPVHDRAGGGDAAPGGDDGLDHFPRGLAGREDVLDDDGGVPGLDAKPAAQREGSVL